MCTRERGLTLIEMIVFILVVSIALTAVLLAMNRTTSRSSDPLVRKQALAIAEGLLEEVQLMPYTYCDADDAHVTTARAATVDATDAAQCASTADAIGPEAGETRYSASAPFDHVGDYAEFDTASATPSGVRDITGSHDGPAGYAASVSVQQSALGNASYSVPGTSSVLVTVTVTGPGNESVRLQGYRTRYAPRAP
ncbi:MAG: type II secretion system protein [Burkholderiales bacterium]|nr:type II secretion system protein [Burkholderiales bacterium]